MERGDITGYIDIAQVTLYAFWIFFAGLILYLRREDKREGYPLESERSNRILVQGYPAIPSPKTFLIGDGRLRSVPSHGADRRDAPVVPSAPWPGAPMLPVGNPMLDGVGPASYADREDIPDRTPHGLPTIAPLRALPDAYVEPRGPDPRGMIVYGLDGLPAGVVSDLWTDRAEALIRYLEVELDTPAGERVLLPLTMAKVDGRRGRVTVRSILARHFADVPRTAQADQVTKREEDRIVGYYGGGYLYATPARTEPLL